MTSLVILKLHGDSSRITELLFVADHQEDRPLLGDHFPDLDGVDIHTEGEETQGDQDLRNNLPKTTTTATRRIRTKQTARTNDYPCIPVGGRLFRFKEAWRGSAFETVVTKGLSWTWVKEPPPLEELYQQTSPDLDQKLVKLKKIRVIEKVQKIKFQSRLFLVPKKDSPEGRLIIDLSRLNKTIFLETFKMLTMNQVRLLLPKHFWTVALDMKDGYWHLPVTPRKRPYLGFRYKGQNWQFRAMPFGLNIGPRIFTKLMAHVVKILASKGIWCLPYLDDLLIVSSSEEECLRHSKIAIATLQSFGWILNEKKSRIKPQQIFHWLGAHFNLQNHTVRAPEEKMAELKSQIKDIVTSKRCTKRKVMRVQGLANWIGQFNPTTRALLSSTKRLLKRLKRRHLDAPLRFTIGMKLSLVKWLWDTIVPQPLGNPTPSVVIQTDASLKGFGFKINQNTFHGTFDKTVKYSINMLELLTIWLALLKCQARNVTIQILCDNSTAISAVKRGTSNVFTLAMVTELIWRRAAARNWTLLISHIQGKFNIIADQLSRGTTISTEWALPPRVFRRIILKMNSKLQVDLFATSLNHQLKTFISPCPDEKAAAVDAMMVDWNRWNHLYLYPPTSLISKVLAKLNETQFQSAVLITPDRPTGPWHMALHLKRIPSTIIKVHLQQIVKGKLVQAPTATRLRVWRLSQKL